MNQTMNLFELGKIGILFILILWGASCNKPYSGGFKDAPITCSPDNTVKFPQDALDRLYFKDSSYWIYVDSASGRIDSVWVQESQREVSNFFQGNYLNKKCYESFSYRLNSRLSLETRVVLSTAYANDELKYEDELFVANYYPEMINNNPIYRFFIKNNHYANNEEGGVFDTIAQMNVGGIYQNVLHLSNPDSNIDVYKDVYYASHVGMIQYKLKDGSVWKLSRYDVKQ